MRIDAGDRGCGAFSLRPPDVLCRMDDLSVQVGERDVVVVNDPERAYTGPRQILQRGRTQAARADHQRPRGFKLVLAGTAQPMQDDLARVALYLFTGEGHGWV